MSSLHFPDDLLLVIFNYFDTYAQLLKTVARVCKRWNNLAKNPKILDQLTLKEIGLPIITSNIPQYIWRDSLKPFTGFSLLMGKNSIEALCKIFTVINNPNSYKGLKPLRSPAEIRNSMLGFIYQYPMYYSGESISNLRNVILALEMSHVQPEQMLKLIDEIFITKDNDFAQKITQAKATIKKLLAHFIGTDDDEDIADLKSLKPRAFTEIIETFPGTYILNSIHREAFSFHFPYNSGTWNPNSN